ncbi:MAG: methyltransferase domain-containing protein [Alphaproteobacteria bacterium]
MPSDIAIFDRRLVRLHRSRAARHLDRHDFLIAEAGERLLERLDDVERRFPLALDLGCHGGELGRLRGQRGGIERLVQVDAALAMARRAGTEAVVAEEDVLPFADASFDLVMSGLSLHWVNDLPGALLQIRRTLKPDGLFLAALLGGETLKELRAVLLEAELAEEGGASPRISPFADARELGGLLQRAGFALPVVDVDTIRVTFADAFALMHDLRGMGEANALRARRPNPTRRSTFMRAAHIYRERFAEPDGRIAATFQIVFLTAWAPHESQQKPLAPGSARMRLSDALGATEVATGIKAKPR